MTLNFRPFRSRPARLCGTLLLCALALTVAACGEDGGGATGKPADTKAEEDTIVWADVPKDSWSQIIDTKAPPKDTGAETTQDTGPKDAGVPLPTPATVPTNLPPGVVAIGVSAASLEEDGKGPVMFVELPAGTKSFLAVVKGAHPGWFSIASAVSPLGDLYGKGQCQPLCESCKNRVQAGAGLGAALFPASTGVKVLAGEWALSACGFEWSQTGNQFSTKGLLGATPDLVVFARTQGVPTAGKLKLRLWLARSGVTAASSHSDPVIEGMIAEAKKVWATAQIELVVIGRHDAPGPKAALLPDGLTVTGASDADKLFAHAAALGGSAVVDVFVVDQLFGAKQGGEDARGYAGGIPGPAFYHGLPGTGVIVAAQANPAGKALGRRLAHELGHFLGLWDTSGPLGKPHDPLENTKECTLADDKGVDDQPADGLLSAEECVGKDGTNPMFWRPEDAAFLTFDGEQGLILRGNPLVFAE